MESYEEVDKFFYIKPTKYTKYDDISKVKYSLGGNLYMNGEIDFLDKILNNSLCGARAITICFEDGCKDNLVQFSEDKTIEALKKLDCFIEEGFNINIPLIFFRVRNLEQFISITSKINKCICKYIAGFVFPKFNSNNGEKYLNHLNNIKERFDDIFFAMPILESKEIIYKETRIEELLKIRGILNNYRESILNIRVGGTDFSSRFSIRRSVNSTIYDIKIVSDVLIDIINLFGRAEEDYVISAPVWEYFSNDINSKEIKGLEKEVILDKENGFCGKTAIHPSQVEIINKGFAITYEEYNDSLKILQQQEVGGVGKGYNENKMNEARPHYNWALKILKRAEAFGVLKEEKSLVEIS